MSGVARQPSTSGGCRAGLRISALALLILAGTPAYAAPPPGFEALAGPERAVVDLYLADRQLGTAQITSFNGVITFEQPQAVLALLPKLRDPAKVIEALSGRHFPANSQLVCTPGADRTSCEQLRPSDIGVIFDRDRFILRVYVSPELLAAEHTTSQSFLKDPERKLGLLANTSAYLSGMAGGAQTINLDSRMLAGFGAGRLRSDMTLSSRYGWKAQTLAAELDRPGWRYTAGLFASHPGLMIGRRQVLGAAITSQIDTRADRDQLVSAPLVVFLEQRSRVDVSRDGRIIATRIFEAGNQVFDTSTFAEGAYELELRITGANGSVKTEQRFFTKVGNRRADSGSSLYALAGLLADDQHGTPFAVRKVPFAQAGGSWALSHRTWFDLSLSATDKTSTAELGIVHYGKHLVARAGGALNSRRDAGAFLQISSNGSSRLNFNFDLRAVKRSSQSPANHIASPETLAAGTSFTSSSADPWLNFSPHSFVQAYSTLTYRLGHGQFRLAANLRKDANGPLDFDLGPSLRWDIVNRRGLQLTFQTDGHISRSQRSLYAGLTLQLFSGQSSAQSWVGGRGTSSSAKDAARLVVGISGSTTLASGERELELGGSLERNDQQVALALNSKLQTRPVTLDTQMIKGFGGSGAPLQYSLGLQSVLAIAGRSVGLSNAASGDGALMLAISEQSKTGQFEVLVNEIPSGLVSAGARKLILLPAYRAYDVRLRPTGTVRVQADTNSQTVTIFPGTVTSLKWQAKAVTPVFGRLTDNDGYPLAGAIVRLGSIAVQSDDRGYFQIEAQPGAELDVSLAGGSTCKVVLPREFDKGPYVRLGTRICGAERKVRQRPAVVASID